MKLNKTPTPVTSDQYANYVHNCLRNAACEPSWAAPVPDVQHLQLYVEFGAYKPVLAQVYVRDICDGHTEQIFATNYVIGQTPDGVWYGVFKYFSPVAVPVTSFVVWFNAEVSTPAGLREITYFSELLQVDPCATLTKVKSCQPEQAVETGFDVNGIYYGLPVNNDYLGNPTVRYFHIAWVRQGKARELPPKATFVSSLTRNFRTSIEKTWAFECEMVPRWYKDVLLAIFARGVVQLNDGTKYLVSDLAYEAVAEDDLRWKPYASFKQTTRLYYGCDESLCIECCAPTIIRASTGDESASVSASASAPTECCAPIVISASAETSDNALAAAFIIATGAEGPDADAINYLVPALEDAGILNKFKAIWPFVGGSDFAHKFNLMNAVDTDGAFRLTFSGGWTHDANGVLPNGTDAYANTHLDPSIVLTAISGSMGVYSRTNNAVGNAYDLVAEGPASSQFTGVICRYSDDSFYGCYGTISYPRITNMDSRGFFAMNRLSISNTEGYKNGVQQYNTADTVSLASLPIFLGASNQNGVPGRYGSRQLAFAYIADGLTSGEHADLYDIVQTFQTMLSRNV